MALVAMKRNQSGVGLFPAVFLGSIEVDLAEILASALATETITVPGVRIGDVVLAMASITSNENIILVAAGVSATDTLQLRFMNVGASPVDADPFEVFVAVLR